MNFELKRRLHDWHQSLGIGGESERVLAINNLLRDLAISLDDHLIDLKRCLDGVFLLVHPLELLEGSALRLDAFRPLAMQPVNNKKSWGTHQNKYHRILSTISQPTKI